MRRALLVSSVFLLAACGAPGQIVPKGSGGGIEGEYVSRSVEGRSLVAGTEIFLRLQKSDLSASAGCNSLGGPYHLEDFDGTTGVLVVDAEGLSMTEIGCDPARHAQDMWLADLLRAKPAVTVTGDNTMSLARGTEKIQFLDREVADPDRPLVGTTWTVDTIISGAAASSVPENGKVTFVFGNDRATVTSDGCTSVVLSYDETGGKITFGSYTVDSIGCPSPWNESLALLTTKTVTYAIDHARLTLTAPDGKGLGLTAG